MEAALVRVHAPSPAGYPARSPAAVARLSDADGCMCLLMAIMTDKLPAMIPDMDGVVRDGGQPASMARASRAHDSGGLDGARVWAAAAVLAMVAAGCGGAAQTSSAGVISAIGAENEYANVLSQIGGRYVHVDAILSNPNTDPHTFESSPSVAEEVSAAQLIVQNGLGYDGFMNRIESASPNSSRRVIVVQDLLGLPGSTPNPHLWYEPTTMPKVATAMARNLS